MLIGLDYSAAAKIGTGLCTYTTGLVEHLVQENPDDQFVLLCRSFLSGHHFKASRAQLAGARERRVPIPGSILNFIWGNFGFPTVEQLMGKLDIFHALDAMAPPRHGCKLVVTIHDLVPLIHPEWVEQESLAWHQRRIKESLKQADGIIADSYATRDDILDLFDCEPARVHVVYAGLATTTSGLTQGRAESPLGKYGIRKPFLLSTGVIEPRKNYTRLIEAYAQLVAEENLDHSLVLVGKKGWQYEEVFHTVSKLNLQDRVIFTGYVDSADLPTIMNEASVFVYPSLYEGFGLPPLEAMRAGVPVVLSNISSLPEIAGGTGILVDPLSIESIAQGIRSTLDLGSDERCLLIKNGRKRASQFSWSRAAAETVELYRTLL